MFRIYNPWFALLLIPLIAIVIFAILRRPPTIITSTLDNFAPIKRIKRKLTFGRRIIPLIFYTIGIVFLIYVVMRPQDGSTRIREKTEGVDIMLAIDVSGSMQTIDVPDELTGPEIQRRYSAGKLPERIKVAKGALTKFIEKRPFDRIGLIAFAGKALTLCPATLEHDFLKAKVQRLTAGEFRKYDAGGTNLTEPIRSAINNLKKSKAKRKVLILFTDGQETTPSNISPSQAAKEMAKKHGVIIYSVGIGGRRSIQKDPFGRPQLTNASDLDEKLLKDIAEISEGLYMTARDEKNFEETMDRIDKLEKTDSEKLMFTRYSEAWKWFLLTAVILIGLGFLLEQTWCLSTP